MQHYLSWVLLGSLVATGCGESTDRQLRGAWSELKLPNAEHADIIRQPNDRDPGWHIDYRGLSQFYGVCKELEVALQPLGFVTAGELPNTPRTTPILVAKADQTWMLSCTGTSDSVAVSMRLLEPGHAAALLRKAI
jgi:hypothetical protein